MKHPHKGKWERMAALQERQTALLERLAAAQEDQAVRLGKMGEAMERIAEGIVRVAEAVLAQNTAQAALDERRRKNAERMARKRASASQNLCAHIAEQEREDGESGEKRDLPPTPPIESKEGKEGEGKEERDKKRAGARASKTSLVLPLPDWPAILAHWNAHGFKSNPQHFYLLHVQRGWVDWKGLPVRNWKAAAGIWENRYLKEHPAIAAMAAPKRPDNAPTPHFTEKDWMLCKENCRHYREGGGCKRGHIIPPDRDMNRPHHPDECDKFDPSPDYYENKRS